MIDSHRRWVWFARLNVKTCNDGFNAITIINTFIILNTVCLHCLKDQLLAIMHLYLWQHKIKFVITNYAVNLAHIIIISSSSIQTCKYVYIS